jgi:hypothetical protein
MCRCFLYTYDAPFVHLFVAVGADMRLTDCVACGQLKRSIYFATLEHGERLGGWGCEKERGEWAGGGSEREKEKGGIDLLYYLRAWREVGGGR